MITIEVEDVEWYDDAKGQFEMVKGGPVRFEYSLLAISEWESIYKKPFLKVTIDGTTDVTEEEMIHLFHLMALDPVSRESLRYEGVYTKLSEYMSDDVTATTFSKNQNGNRRVSPKVYTSEQIYAMMFMNGIPLEWENRNLNRLMVILNVVGSYNDPQKKMTRKETALSNAQINAQRKKQLNTKG